MTGLILHHHDLSPFCEKIRLALGYKDLAWLDRVAAIAHGRREALSPADVLRVARDAMPEPVSGVVADDRSGLKGGEWVTIHSDAANDPIAGELVAANPTEIVIRHEHEAVGTVHVHFPRFGYSAVAEAR